MNMPPTLDEELSSLPSEISSPPSSPPLKGCPRQGDGVHSISATPAQPATAQNLSAHTSHAVPSSATTNTTTNATSTAAVTDAKPKRQRKPRDPKDAKPSEPAKEKKPRKPREPKAKKDPDHTTASARKRQKTEENSTPAPAEAQLSRQPLINEMMLLNPAQPASAPSRQPFQSTPQSAMHTPIISPLPLDPVPRTSLPPHASQHPPPRPFSSGQNYDPIRGSTIDSTPRPAVAAATATTTTTTNAASVSATTTTGAPAISPAPTAAATNGALSAQASPHVNHASASPSIISLIDPAPTTKSVALPQPLSSSQVQKQLQQPPSLVLSKYSPTPPKAASQSLSSQPSSFQKQNPNKQDGTMELDGPSDAPLTKSQDAKAPSKSSSSTAPAPKPAPVKVTSPPKATGCGLLSSSDLFGGPSASIGAERKGVDIEIQIPLNPNGGNTINLAQEIAKRYGRDAINPRAAAHRERLLQVAAAANRIDGGSADDMSVDLMSDVEGDSNVEMGGIDEEKSATGADDKPRKRKKKVEEYDKEDDFIDDTELAWQEQAAVAKDGFFVYSGPLVPIGQDAKVETTAPRGRGGGRGRGRGRASATAATTTAAAAAAAAVSTTSNGVASTNEKKESSTGRGRGRGRGTGAPRKPRITKADRERMEAEKQERMASGTTSQTITQAAGQMIAPLSTPSLSGASTSSIYAVHQQAATQGGVPV